MSKDILYLGSQSKSRQKLLGFAQITYKVLQHKSEEKINKDGLAFEDYVLKIAQDKMQSLSFPQDVRDLFVLTSDTVARMQENKIIFKKPKNLSDAKKILTEIGKGPVEVFTACCLDKKVFEDGGWKNIEHNHFVVKTIVEFYINQDEIDLYLKNMPQAKRACGSVMIEDFGNNYLKSVNGSYSSVLGLPIYEVRCSLKKMGFEF